MRPPFRRLPLGVRTKKKSGIRRRDTLLLGMSNLYITTQGASLRKRGGTFVVARGDSELCTMPGAMVEAVLLFGHVQVTTQAAHALLDEGIPLLYLTMGGGFKGMLQPGCPKNTEARLSQYEASLRREDALAIARAMVDAKLASSLSVLDRWTRNGWNREARATARELRRLRGRLGACATVGSLRAVEGQAAALYFGALGDALPPEFTWQGRNRQPPRDPVNALLSLTYMLLLGRAVAQCFATGLDPNVGFLHQLEYGRPSLALDLLEPLRAPCCDQFVLRTLQSEELDPGDFKQEETLGCRLRPEALPRFLAGFQAWSDPEGSPAARLLPRLARELRESIRDRRPPDWAGELA